MHEKAYMNVADKASGNRRRLPSVDSLKQSMSRMSTPRLPSLSVSLQEARNRLKSSNRRSTPSVLDEDLKNAMQSSLVDRPEETDGSEEDEDDASSKKKKKSTSYARKWSQLLPSRPKWPAKSPNNQHDHIVEELIAQGSGQHGHSNNHDTMDNNQSNQQHALGHYGIMGEPYQARQSVYRL